MSNQEKLLETYKELVEALGKDIPSYARISNLKAKIAEFEQSPTKSTGIDRIVEIISNAIVEQSHTTEVKEQTDK